jgi:hypothetical protein
MDEGSTRSLEAGRARGVTAKLLVLAASRDSKARRDVEVDLDLVLP